MAYYGIYRSSTTSQTGCVKAFVTTAQDTPSFPPQVGYFCDLCKSHHGFRLWRSQTVTSPSHIRQFTTYCADQGIEAGVELPTK